MANNEDDEVTKVIDLNNFNLNDSHENQPEIFLLNYKTKYFNENLVSFKKYFIVNLIDSLEDLNKLIMKFPEMNLGLYYNDEPKIINAILKQINEHFKLVNSIIFAENLSEEKVALHQKQVFNAKHYHDIANNLNQIADLLK